LLVVRRVFRCASRTNPNEQGAAKLRAEGGGHNDDDDGPVWEGSLPSGLSPADEVVVVFSFIRHAPLKSRLDSTAATKRIRSGAPTAKYGPVKLQS